MTQMQRKNRFIAWWPHTASRDLITNGCHTLKTHDTADTLGWTQPNDYHVTIGYLPLVETAHIDEVIELISARVNGIRPVDCVLGRGHALGSAITVLLSNAEPIQTLHATLAHDFKTQSLYPFRCLGPYTPHITLAKAHAHSTSLLPWVTDAFKGHPLCLDEIGLFETKASPNAQGRYQAVWRHRLTD